MDSLSLALASNENHCSRQCDCPEIGQGFLTLPAVILNLLLSALWWDLGCSRKLVVTHLKQSWNCLHAGDSLMQTVLLLKQVLGLAFIQAGLSS